MITTVIRSYNYFIHFYPYQNQEYIKVKYSDLLSYLPKIAFILRTLCFVLSQMTKPI